MQGKINIIFLFSQMMLLNFQMSHFRKLFTNYINKFKTLQKLTGNFFLISEVNTIFSSY